MPKHYLTDGPAPPAVSKPAEGSQFGVPLLGGIPRPGPVGPFRNHGQGVGEGDALQAGEGQHAGGMVSKRLHGRRIP